MSMMGRLLKYLLGWRRSNDHVLHHHSLEKLSRYYNSEGGKTQENAGKALGREYIFSRVIAVLQPQLLFPFPFLFRSEANKNQKRKFAITLSPSPSVRSSRPDSGNEEDSSLNTTLFQYCWLMLMLSHSLAPPP